MAKVSFSALGKSVKAAHGPEGLEVFDAPEFATSIELDSDEVTAVCPVTGQPDWYRVRVVYRPRRLCLESKSFKLYLWSFRNAGIFCEGLASAILKDLGSVLKPMEITVTVIQKPRGGISISATAAARRTDFA